MSAIREEIRTILREELAALRGELCPHVETVSIRSGEDLGRFAQSILERAQNPSFAAALRAGEISFALLGPAAPEFGTNTPPRPIVSGPAPAPITNIDRKLVTERDISELSTRHIRIPKSSRITPLAQDEARRKGIRIERVEA